MSLLSEDIVVEEESEVEDGFSSLAHPAREASAKAARHVMMKVGRQTEVLVIFITVTIRWEHAPPMG